MAYLFVWIELIKVQYFYKIKSSARSRNRNTLYTISCFGWKSNL